MLAGLLHLALFLAGCPILAVLGVLQPGTFLRRVGRLGLFLGLLLLMPQGQPYDKDF